jgi:hypothetical protein
MVLFCTACGPRQLRITMNADNNSGQTGFALLVDQGRTGMLVTVETNLPDISTPQKAHIHTGTCGEIGPVVAPLNDLTSLPNQPGRFGSTTQVELTFDALTKSAHALNTHDARDFGVYVSCGDIAAP